MRTAEELEWASSAPFAERIFPREPIGGYMEVVECKLYVSRTKLMGLG
jgi:hypothetical protein